MRLIYKINPKIFNEMEKVGLVKCKCGRLKEWVNNEWHCICENEC